MTAETGDRQELLREIEELTLRLAEAEETLEAISSGAVDALVVTAPSGDESVFTLEGADRVYRTFLESIDEGALTLSDSGVILYANAAAARLMPLDAGRLLGGNLRRCIHRDDRERFDALLKATRHQSAGAELRLRGRAARTVYLSLRALDGLTGNVVVAILADLTERKKTEKALEAERLASAILEETSEAIIVCDAKGVVIRASRSVDRLVGGDPSFELLETVLPLRTPDGEAWHLPGEKSFDPVKGLEVEFRHDDGSVRSLIMNVDPLRTRREGLIGSVLTLTDISDRKRMEEELRHALAESQSITTLLDESVQPFATGTPDGRLLLVNRPFARLTGYSADELKSMEGAWSEVLTPPEWRAGEAELLAELERSGQPVRYEKEYIRKDGSRIPVELLVHLVSDADGKAAFYYCFVTDITERRRKDEAERLEDAKRAAEAERSRLARDLHDSVTQALFAASLKAEALTLENMDSERASQAAREVNRLTRGALAQMRTMLLELRGQRIEDIPIRQLLNTVVLATEGRCSAEVTLTVEGDDTLPGGVHAAVYRVAQEALNNVSKHARAAHAWVSLEATSRLVRLEVRDDGCGFEPGARNPSHMGLISMEERAREAGAELSLRTGPHGTLVKFDWSPPAAG